MEKRRGSARGFHGRFLKLPMRKITNIARSTEAKPTTAWKVSPMTGLNNVSRPSAVKVSRYALKIDRLRRPGFRPCPTGETGGGEGGGCIGI
jgi:hypothetical protein